jgi:formylglycine-generating enzyme required for sulfatase activity
MAMLAAGCGRAPESEGDGPKMEFVRIPAGSFYMGSPATEEGRDDNEGPVHEVRITKPFYMGKYEVTQAQWKAVMGTTVRQQRDKASMPWHLKREGPEHPIYYVSWEEAVEFCKRLGRKFRLPTEAEWEYACRAGSQTRFYYGDDPNCSEFGQYAWYEDNSDNKTHPVGQKKPNAWGLYDMYGNVDEWCSDRNLTLRGHGRHGVYDPTGLASAENPYHVCRGGSWFDYAGSRQSWGKERFRVDITGFRVVYAGRIKGGKDVLEIALPQKTGGIVSAGEHDRELRPRGPVISGAVRDKTSMLVDGVSISALPIRDWVEREYADGKFEICRQPQGSNAPTPEFHFVAQHKARNLAVGIKILEGADTLDVKLKPGVIVTGRVVDGNGNGIGDMRVEINLRTSNWSGDYLTQVKSDAEGRFEIRALPQGYDYVLSVRTLGYRTDKTEIHSDDVRDNRIDGISIVLQRGEFSISGVVVDADGKTVPNIRVYCTAKGQPVITSHSDAGGKFTLDGVFKGRVKVMAGGHKLYGSVNTEAGATNVRIVLDNEGAPPGKGRACFPDETGVWINGEVVRISRVDRGQTVGHFARAMPTVPLGQVETIEEHEGIFECRAIVLENGNHISVVDAHCFMLDSGKWIAAPELRNGLRLKTLHGTVEIKSVVTRATPYIGKVYNLKIRNSDYYMVGKDGVIVRDY